MQLSCHIKLLALEKLVFSQLFFSDYLQMFKKKNKKNKSQAWPEKIPQNMEHLSVRGLPGAHPQNASGWGTGSCRKDRSLRETTLEHMEFKVHMRACFPAAARAGSGAATASPALGPAGQWRPGFNQFIICTKRAGFRCLKSPGMDLCVKCLLP